MITLRSVSRDYATLKIEKNGDLTKFKIIQSGFYFGEIDLTYEQINRRIKTIKGRQRCLITVIVGADSSSE